MKKTILTIALSLIYTQSYALGLGNDNPVVDAGVSLTLSPTISAEINPNVSTTISPTLNTNITPNINVNPNVVVAPVVSVNPNLKLSPTITTDITNKTNINNDVLNNNNSNAVSNSESNSNAQSNQSQSNDNSNSNNSNQSITVQGDSTVYKQARIPVSSALAPTNLPTALCMGSSSGAVQSTLFGFSLGSSWTDKNCMVLEQVRSASTVLGDVEVAEEIMCSLKEYKEARARLNRPCR